MPETSFSCRNKIVGSYYADPETDCQVFHVCVSVAGTIQDYKWVLYIMILIRINSSQSFVINDYIVISNRIKENTFQIKC